jgi:hypothetical protein
MSIVDFPHEQTRQYLEVFFEGCVIHHIHEIKYRGVDGEIKAMRYFYTKKEVKEEEEVKVKKVAKGIK